MQKKRGNVCCPFHVPRLLHCLSKLNRQRQSPRRYENQSIGESVNNHHTEKVQFLLTSLLWNEIITPGASTVGFAQDYDTDNLLDYRGSQTQRQVNAFNMSGLNILPNTRFIQLGRFADAAVLYSA